MKKVASGYRLILGYLGLFIVFIGIATLIPLLTLLAYPEEAGDWYCFAMPGVCSIIIGLALYFLIFKREKAQLGKHQDSVLLVLVWVISIMISAVPFIIKGNLTFFCTTLSVRILPLQFKVTAAPSGKFVVISKLPEA